MYADAQILKDLERAAVNKARSMNTKENRDKLANALVKEMDRARSEFDSTDFDYAILLRHIQAAVRTKLQGSRIGKACTA